MPQTSEELKQHLLSFVDEKAWLFDVKTNSTGYALVKLNKRKRQFINIFPGSNTCLLDRIKEKGEEKFIDFLASAKWIHMTSLKDVFHFKCIAEYVKKAKEKNPYLMLSIDPGYDYTKNHWDIMKAILPIADYIFFSKSELANISNNLGLSTKSKMVDLGEELISCGAQSQIIIIKGKSCSVLLSLFDKKPFVRTYYHKRLFFSKILNDTGAGDAFAGGFIAAILSPLMLSHQPAPIQLAAIAASERLQSIDWPTGLNEKARNFFHRNMKNESLNKRQWLKLHFDFLKSPIVKFILGVVTGIISSAIFSWLSNY